jgi:hypothetical protein
MSDTKTALTFSERYLEQLYKELSVKERKELDQFDALEFVDANEEFEKQTALTMSESEVSYKVRLTLYKRIASFFRRSAH